MNQFNFLRYLTVYLKSDDVEGVGTFVEIKGNTYLITTEEVARKTTETSVTLHYKKKRAVYQTTLDLKLDWRFFYDSNLAYCDIKEIQKVVKTLFGGNLYFSSIKEKNIVPEAAYNELKDYIKTSIIGYICDEYPIPIVAQSKLEEAEINKLPEDSTPSDTPILSGSPILVRNMDMLVGVMMDVADTDNSSEHLSIFTFVDDLMRI